LTLRKEKPIILLYIKGVIGMEESMTKEEMQRFLNREAEKGATEYEALKALADILGIEFPELKSK